jgi:hypothetical protein
MHIDFSGRGAIALATSDAAASRYLESAFAPFSGLPDTPHDAVVSLMQVPAGSIRLQEYQRAADDDLVTASDGEHCFVIWDGWPPSGRLSHARGIRLRGGLPTLAGLPLGHSPGRAGRPRGRRPRRHASCRIDRP